MNLCDKIFHLISNAAFQDVDAFVCFILDPGRNYLARIHIWVSEIAKREPFMLTLVPSNLVYERLNLVT